MRRLAGRASPSRWSCLHNARNCSVFRPHVGSAILSLCVSYRIGTSMSLIGNTENDSACIRLRRRIIADFRDMRFTARPAFLRWTGTVIMAFLVAALIMLYFLDWNQMRGPIGRYASARAGREVRIDGDLKVDLFRWQPHVEVGGLYIGNPSWLAKPAGQVGRPQGAAVKQAIVEFRLVPAIFGNWILPLVRLDQPDALVVRDARRPHQLGPRYSRSGGQLAYPADQPLSGQGRASGNRRCGCAS